MSKKKKSPTSASGQKSSYFDAIGLSNIFANDKTNFTVGITLFIFAVFVITCLVSYFSTSASDQSLVLHPLPGDFTNTGHVFSNYCGSWGAYISHFLIAMCFGIPAFMVPLFLLICSLACMGVYKINLWKWFFAMMIIMIWSSVFFAKFINPMFSDIVFNVGGGHGEYICQYLENIVGPPGLTAVLALTAILFLTYLTSETITVIRNILNPIGYITGKVKFTIANIGKDGEKLEIPSENESAAVYDDPASQTITFDDDKVEIHDAGYVDGSDNTAKDKSSDRPVGASDDSADSVAFDISQGETEEAFDGKSTMGEDEMTPFDPKAELSRYKYPTLDLLKKYDTDGKSFIDVEEQTTNKNRIVEVLSNFGVQVSSIKATVGPTITLYEITLAPGIRFLRSVLWRMT